MDDVIVFLTGEKTNLTSTEDSINCHEEVRSAMKRFALRLSLATKDFKLP